MPLPFVPILAGLANAKPILQKYWKEIGIAALLGLMAYQNFADTRYLFFMETIPSLERRLAKSMDNFNTCKEGNDALKDSIEKRNTEIEQWKKLTGKLQQRNNNLEGEIATSQQDTQNAVDVILDAPTPQSCAEAVNLLRNTGDLKW